MKRLENLSEIASRQLGGLEATPTLLARVKLEAAERQKPRSVQAMASVCPMISCSTLSTLAAACKRLAY